MEDRQNAILSVFELHNNLGKLPPTFQEIIDQTDITSKSIVSHHLGILVQKGYLIKSDRLTRQYELKNLFLKK